MKKKICLIIFLFTLITLIGCNMNNKKYSIYFISDDVLIKEVITSGNEIIEIPSSVTKEGYELVCWCFEDGTIFTNTSYLNEKLTSSIIITAKWKEKEYVPEYSIYFMSDDELIKEVITSGNEIIEIPSSVTKEGYELVCWCFEDGTVFTNTSYLNEALTMSIVIMAKWEKNEYEINYCIDINLENNNPKKYNINDNDIILQSVNKEKYDFIGWYTDESLDEKYKIEVIKSSSKQDYVLYPKWEKNEYVISYIIDEDLENLNPKKYNTNDNDIILQSVNKEKYDFIGWYTDESLDEKYKIEVIKPSSKQDYVLYPKWKLTTKTITYIVDEKVVHTDELFIDELIELYKIDNLKWYYYVEEELVVFNLNYMPDLDIKLYGYEIKEYEISFDSNGGEKLESIVFKEGDDVYIPKISNSDYKYIFDGWYYNGELLSKGDENITINKRENIQLKASWKDALSINFNDLTKYSISSIEDNDIIILDFSQTEENLEGKSIIIKDTVNTVILVGKTGRTYLNFSISIGARYNDVKIILNNFNYQSNKNTAFYAKTVSEEYKVTIEINGTSSIKSGKGSNGSNGKSYNMSADVNNANNGGNGTNGESGYIAIEANNLVINCNKDSLLNVYGGTGGTGGNGGNGQGSNGPKKKTAGQGGTGGQGGIGGDAIDIYNSLEFIGQGVVNIYGGAGGTGGNGGNGGHATVNYSTDNPDNGGAGGTGGKGGTGGLGINFRKQGTLILNNGIDVTVIGGAGGKGGDGGDGGNTVSTIFYSAGSVGSAGVYGSGGSAGQSVNDTNINNSVDYSLLNKKEGNKGLNGYAGTKGKIS